MTGTVAVNGETEPETAFQIAEVRSGSKCEERELSRHVRFTAKIGRADGVCCVYEFMT
jgi:hypothetical protein